jgi:hypothetical protein
MDILESSQEYRVLNLNEVRHSQAMSCEIR